MCNQHLDEIGHSSGNLILQKIKVGMVTIINPTSPCFGLSLTRFSLSHDALGRDEKYRKYQMVSDFIAWAWENHHPYRFMSVFMAVVNIFKIRKSADD